MKNSLFKRAVAAVSAVPLALTQCLTVANAVTVNDAAVSLSDSAINAAEEKDVTVDTLLKIVADESDDVQYEEITGSDTILCGETADELIAEYGEGRTDVRVFTKASDWNLTAYSYIQQTEKKTGTINIDQIKETIVKRAKGHGEAAEHALDWLSNVSYKIEDNGDITLTAKVDQPAFTQSVAHTPVAVLAKHGITGVDFSAIKVSGEFVIKIGTSALSSGTKFTTSLVFNSDAQGTITAGKLATYAKGVVQQYLDTSIAAVEASDLTAAQKESAIKDLSSEADWYTRKLVRVENEAKHFLTEVNREGEFDAVSGIIEVINTAISNRGFKYQLKPTATDILTSGVVNDVYTDTLDRVNKAAGSYNINISAGDLGAAIDKITDITASLKYGVAEATGHYEDAESAEVAEFFKTYLLPEEYEVLADFKAGKAQADATKVVSAGSVDLDGDFQRVVVVAPVTTTTTTTTTSTTTTTTTATSTTSTTDSETETSTTATSTTESGTETSTTVTSTTDDTDVTTTSTTEVTTDTTTEPSTDTTTTTEPSTDTTTSTTETSTETSTTTSTTATTTTSVGPDDRPVYVVTTVAAEVHLDSSVGFYLNIDKEFNKDQINDIYYSVDEEEIWYYADDNTVYKTETIKSGERVDIDVDDIDFGDQLPENIYDDTDNIFSYAVNLYAKNDIEGLAKAGEPLKFVAGDNVSVIAYIGVKGDADLDKVADSADASAVLVYYAALSTGGRADTTQLSPSGLVKGADDILDHFAAFLADVDAERTPAERVATNYKDYKSVRTIDSADSSSILTFYALMSTISDPVPNRENWDSVLDITV